MTDAEMEGFHRALCGVFVEAMGAPPIARYLLYRMLFEGILIPGGEPWDGGLDALSKRVGYSKKCLIGSLEELVARNLLVPGKNKVGAWRPTTTYRLAPQLSRTVKKNRFYEAKVLQVLDPRGTCSSELSISERCLLAQLWLKLWDSPIFLHGQNREKACVLVGVGASALAKDIGVSRETVKRLIGRLNEKGFIVSSAAKFNGPAISGNTKAHFLLGPKMLLQEKLALTWCVELSGYSALLGSDKNYDVQSLVSNYLESNSDAEKLASSLQRLNDPSLRYYILIYLCAAASNGTVGVLERSITSVALHAENALLRSLDMVVLQHGGRHWGIENYSIEQVEACDQFLLEFVQHFSSILADEFRLALNHPEHGRFPKNDVRYFSCCPVLEEGVFKLRVNVVFRLCGSRWVV